MTKAKNRNWFDKHLNDMYVLKSKTDGYRSRASYKLLEILEGKNLIQRNDVVVDLGSAPGGWSQVARKFVGSKGRVLALDILDMSSIPGVEFICGDFNDEEVYRKLACQVENEEVNVVISDIAPNISGIAAIDLPKHFGLVELAFEFCRQYLCEGGSFIVKLFQGEGFDEFVRESRKCFVNVKLVKPKASRRMSREIYMVGIGFNLKRSN